MARKHTDEELLKYIQLYLEGNSFQTLVDDYHLKLSSRRFRTYLRKYQLHGIDGISYQKNNRTYTKEFKDKVVSEHLETHYPPDYLAHKYNIPSENTVYNWIKRYTEGKENKTYSPNLEVYNIMSAKKLTKKK